MSKVYILLSLVLMMLELSAQRSSLLKESPFVIDEQIPQVISDNSRAAGDTLFFFNGRYISGKGISNSTSSIYALQDIDQNTLSTRYTSNGYPAKAAFVISHQAKTPGDTNYYFAAVSDFTPPGTANDWMSLGPIMIPAAGATLYWKHNYPDGDFRDGYKVYINTVALGASNFTSAPIFTTSDNDLYTKADTGKTPYFVFYKRSVSLAAYAGKSIYIGFQHNAANLDRVLIDDIFVKEYASTDVGIEETNTSGNFLIYPNPSMGVFTINFGKSIKNIVEVYTAMGEKIYSEQFTTTTASINLSEFKAGVYSLKVIGSESNFRVKEVVITK